MDMNVFAELLGATITSAGVGSVLPPAPTLVIPDVELSDDWKDFEQILAKYKKEYVETMGLLNQKERDVREMKKMRALLSRMAPSEIRAQMMSLVENYERPEAEMLDIAGKVKAMERVLMHTNAARYSQFTCPICMDRLSNIFLDPCGHLMCDTCLNRTHQTTCPTCRVEITPKRIYTTM